jgi:uncharacterized protein YggU (UPF0235/DUF167 family)
MEPVSLRVKVHPGAGKDVLIAVGPHQYEAWVRAKPLEGRANEAVAALLALGLGVPVSTLRLVKGSRGRVKVFRWNS